VLAFQCRNPIHKAHYELFIRALEADNVRDGAVCLVHPTCGPTQVCLLNAMSSKRWSGLIKRQKLQSVCCWMAVSLVHPTRGPPPKGFE